MLGPINSSWFLTVLSLHKVLLGVIKRRITSQWRTRLRWWPLLTYQCSICIDRLSKPSVLFSVAVRTAYCRNTKSKCWPFHRKVPAVTSKFRGIVGSERELFCAFLLLCKYLRNLWPDILRAVFCMCVGCLCTDCTRQWMFLTYFDDLDCELFAACKQTVII